MSIAHAGFGIAILGIVANTTWTQSYQGLLRPGEHAELGGYTLTLGGAERVPGPNYDALRADMTVRSRGRVVARLHPEQRDYAVPPMQTTEAAIHHRAGADLYAVVGSPQDGAFPVRFYIKPLAPWIWGGAVIMALGGLISLSDRRLRVGAPVARRRAKDAPAAHPARA
jgi:cytochrome c-type biogenesis protein CcmF